MGFENLAAEGSDWIEELPEPLRRHYFPEAEGDLAEYLAEHWSFRHEVEALVNALFARKAEATRSPGRRRSG